MTTNIVKIPFVYTEPNENDLNTFKLEIDNLFKKISDEINNNDTIYDIQKYLLYRYINLTEDNPFTIDRQTLGRILIKSVVTINYYEYIFEKNHKLFMYKLILLPHILSAPDTWYINYIDIAITKYSKYDTSILCKSTLKDEHNNQCMIS